MVDRREKLISAEIRRVYGQHGFERAARLSDPAQNVKGLPELSRHFPIPRILLGQTAEHFRGLCGLALTSQDESMKVSGAGIGRIDLQSCRQKVSRFL